MRYLATLLALVCCSCSSHWSQKVEGLPLHAEEVVEAVASLPECGVLRKGGEVHWRASISCGQQGPVQVPISGCAHPDDDPPYVEVTMRVDAWEGTPDHPEIPTLAHELCHICGYTDGPDKGEKQADACAMRAKKAAGR
jgi:hypothetical protein